MAEKKRLSWDEIMRLPVEKLSGYSHVPIRIFKKPEEIFTYLAEYTLQLVKEYNQKRIPLKIIWPCGPKRHFPLLADMTNRQKVSWKNVFNIQVDEWLDWKGRCLPQNHPFNLQSYLRRELFNRIEPGLRPDEDHLIFHDPLQLEKVDKKLDELGSADILFGGFGFTGHIGYNEPPVSRWHEIDEKEFLEARTHLVPTNEETFIMHAHRSTGGNTRLIPPFGITLGLKDILAAKRIRLASDGGAWKQSILRVLCLHEPTVKYPVTFVQRHADAEVIVDAKTADCPPDIFNN